MRTTQVPSSKVKVILRLSRSYFVIVHWYSCPVHISVINEWILKLLAINVKHSKKNVIARPRYVPQRSRSHLAFHSGNLRFCNHRCLEYIFFAHKTYVCCSKGICHLSHYEMIILNKLEYMENQISY